MAAANISESISDRPLKNLFSIFGLLVGAGISKFLSRTFIVYPTFTDPNTAGLYAGALTVIVILTSAWLNGKFGAYVAAKINARDSTKSIKTSIAWGVSIVSFILYLFAAGLLSEFSRINAHHQVQRQNIPNSQQAPSHDQQTVKTRPPFVDPFDSNQPATTAQTNRLDNISNAPVASQSTQQLENLRTQANMNPGKVNGWITYGNSLMDSQQYDEAIEAYKKVLAIDPNNVDVRVDMGTCNRNVSRPDVAIEEFRKAIKLNPNHLNAHRNLAIVLAFDMKDRAAGIKEFEKFLELAPNAPDAAQIRTVIETLKAGN